MSKIEDINIQKKKPAFKVNDIFLNYLKKYNRVEDISIDYDDLMKIKDLDNRSINSLLQEGARLVRNQYVEQIAQERKTRTTLRNRYATLR